MLLDFWTANNEFTVSSAASSYLFQYRTMISLILSQWLAVEILISGLAFEVEDFVRPWESHGRNLERYRGV